MSGQLAALPPDDARGVRPEDLLAVMQARQDGFLPGLLGFVITEVGEGRVAAQLTVAREHLSPNGHLHGGTVVTLADHCAGVGCVASLPAHAGGFTTVELKTNFLSTAVAGTSLRCEATMAHGGRTTQIWDAVVRTGDDRTLALFRCTQLLLDRPRTAQG